ncbi:DUF2778 domain-containing protein [Pararhizobium mangrovi]|nr:DUF2778 domain-containing protein [Pararhizobium mangrovi]
MGLGVVLAGGIGFADLHPTDLLVPGGTQHTPVIESSLAPIADRAEAPAGTDVAQWMPKGMSAVESGRSGRVEATALRGATLPSNMRLVRISRSTRLDTRPWMTPLSTLKAMAKKGLATEVALANIPLPGLAPLDTSRSDAASNAAQAFGEVLSGDGIDGKPAADGEPSLGPATLAYASPDMVPSPRPQLPKSPLATLQQTDGKTAVYDIKNAVVYMPGGDKLEAHSGLGKFTDTPRYADRKNRGPTPPNIYDLTMRKQLFHGVRAVRMLPSDGRNRFGRDGFLAHTYMLRGRPGQSNGCVVFKNYDKFLNAFKKGRVDRIIVVKDLSDLTIQMASR